MKLVERSECDMQINAATTIMVMLGGPASAAKAAPESSCTIIPAALGLPPI